jgi:hypothetical protein
MCIGCDWLTLLKGAPTIDALKGSFITFTRLEYASIVSSHTGHVPLATEDIVDVLTVSRSLITPASSETELVVGH